MQFSYAVYNIYVMFYNAIAVLPRILKSKSVYFKSVLISRSKITGPVTRGHVKSS